MINDLFQADASGLPKVQLRLDLETAELPVDRAISFGLILNELATNAFKHAFRGRDSGEIQIKLQTVPRGEIRLRFADNGRGFAAPSSWESADSLGLRLLRMLTRQLGGQIEMRSDRGTTVELSFKIDPVRISPGSNEQE